MSLEERIKYAEMKTRHNKKLKPWYKKWWGVLMLLVLAIILIFLVTSSLYVVNKVKDINQEQSLENQLNQRLATEKAIMGINPYHIGAQDPKITIVEFSDFACPFCQQSSPIINDIIKDYGDQVKLIFRNYPLHTNSIELAIAARCAGEQDKFWPMHNELFAEQDKLTDTGDTLQNNLLIIANNLGININQFSECISSERGKAAIKADYDDGEALQIEGTPTWFINNYRITGYINEDQFREIVTGLLQQYGTN